jgi:hypothetical protein
VAEEHSRDEFVTVFASRQVQAEIEAEAIHGLLESAGLESIIVRENVPELPTGQVFVRVLASDREDAERLIADARESSRLREQQAAESETE